MTHFLSGNERNLSEFISQVFVIHETGVVFLSRRYDSGCFSEETQLIGGFLGALLNFVELKTHGKRCEKDPSGFHELEEIQMSCSVWLIKKHEEFFIVFISDKDSIVSQIANKPLKNELINQTLIAIDIVKSFQELISDHIFLDHSDEFGIIIDNMYNETFSNYFQSQYGYMTGTKIAGQGQSVF